MKSNTTPRPVLAEGAVYWADGGRRVCVRCAGQSALYTGRDISGQRVARVTLDDVLAWLDDLGFLHCESNGTGLVAVAGPDGWEMAKAAVCPGWCEGRIADHDDRGWGPWACPVGGDDSDADLGKPCTDCAARGGGGEDRRHDETVGGMRSHTALDAPRRLLRDDARRPPAPARRGPLDGRSPRRYGAVALEPVRRNGQGPR